MKRSIYLLFVITLFSSLCSLLTFALPLYYANLSYENGSTATEFLFDRENTVLLTNATNATVLYGGNTYMDHTITNPNMWFTGCHPSLGSSNQIDLRYYTISRNLSVGLVYFPPLTLFPFSAANGSGTSFCSTVDVDLAGGRAVFPGHVYPALLSGNTTVYDYSDTSLFFNGSYRIGVSVQSLPRVYSFSVENVYDHNGSEINGSDSFMAISLVDENNNSLAEGIRGRSDSISYTQSLNGGEQIFVNDVLSLEVILVDPCQEINESGFYLLNESLINVNSTCFDLDNLTNVVLNFGDELLDGDNQTNGSLGPDVCPLTIRNSQNITIENLRTQEFRYGVCVVNSTVSFFGNNSVYHNESGALITNNSEVNFIDIAFLSNSENAIQVMGNSTVNLFGTNLQTANITGEFYNLNVSPVPNEPDPPDFLQNGSFDDIDQYIEFNKNDDDGWALIRFAYTDPLPNGVVTDNVTVYKFNGTLVTSTTQVFDNNTNTTINVTTTDWEGGNWTELFTLVSTSEQLIRIDNISNFSVFAPFGPIVDPEDVPEPIPVTVTTSGSGGGGGGTPARATFSEADATPFPVELELEIPNRFEVVQGEAIDIPFNVTNIGILPAFNVTLIPDTPQNWESTSYSFDVVDIGETVNNSIQIAPFERTTPMEYIIPVNLYAESTDEEPYLLIRTFIEVTVLPRGNISRIRILEYPPVIELTPFQELPVSFLVENIGDVNLTGVTIRYEENDCVSNISGSSNIESGSFEIINFTFFANGPSECNYNAKFYDSTGTLVGFVPLTLLVKERSWLDEPVKVSALLFVLIIWTLLTMYMLQRRRRLG